MASKQLDDKDLDKVRGCLELLNEMKEAATVIDEMKGDVPTKVMKTLLLVRKQMAQIVEAKSMFGNMMDENPSTEDETVTQIQIYLDMIDLIDICVNEYKQKYMKLQKEKLSQISKEQKKVQKKLEK